MLIVFIILIIIVILILGINFFVVLSTQRNIITEEDAKELENVDCILILGAGIWGEEPSPMLEDRLLQGISLYKNQVSPKIIMSGDHGTQEYDEVNVMKDFAIEKGVPSEDIFMDHAGFSTYESIYRAKQYHLYRALYIAKQFEIEAYGVPSNPRKYSGQVFREIREVFARDKDWIQCIVKPKPTYLGESIPVSGNGDITNDK